MTTMMPSQDMVLGMINNSIRKALDDINGADGRRNSASELSKDQVKGLESWIRSGRENDYMAKQNENRAHWERNPMYIMNEEPAAPGVTPAIWPGPVHTPESAHSKALGDGMEANAKKADAAFADLLGALEEALEPYGADGKSYYWTGELTPDADPRHLTLAEAVSAYSEAMAVYHDDVSDYQKSRAIDRQTSPTPPGPVPIPGPIPFPTPILTTTPDGE